MANYANLKADIQAVIKQNGNQEITGNVLQQSLIAMISALGNGYLYKGIATPSTDPGTPDQNIYYIASTAGTYANMGGLTLDDGEVAIIKYNGSWSKDITGIAPQSEVNQLGQKVDGVEANNYYFVCDSSSRTYEKSISGSDANKYQLLNGGNIFVYFTNGNTAENISLKIGTQPRKALYYNGKPIQVGNDPFYHTKLLRIYYDGVRYNSTDVDITSNKTFDAIQDIVVSSYLQAANVFAVTDTPAEFDIRLNVGETTAEFVAGDTISMRLLGYTGGGWESFDLPKNGDAVHVKVANASNLDKKRFLVSVAKEQVTTAGTISTTIVVNNINWTFLKELQSQIDNIHPSAYFLKNQGAINVNKILVVGQDGIVVPGENTPVGVLVGYGKIEAALILNLKADIASEVSVGAGWSGSLSNGYTHASGNTANLVLGHTEENKKYIVTLDFDSISEASVEVKIGNGYPVDPYNGTLQSRIGFVSDGGDLTIIPASTYTGTLSVKLQEVTDTEHSVEEVTISIKNFDEGLMVNSLTGFWNIAVGPDAGTMGSVVNASRCIGIGYSALGSLQSGSRNIALGTFALAQLRNGKGNIGIGADAYYQSQGGNDNIAIGRASMGGSTASVNGNVCIGQSAGEQASGDDNVCIGHLAGYYANSGNVFIGLNTGYSHRAGVNNIFIGRNAGYSGAQRTGDWNTCIGQSAGMASGISKSVAIGYHSGAEKSNQVVLGNYSATPGDGTVETLVHGAFVVRGTDGTRRELVFNQDGSVTWTTQS